MHRQVPQIAVDFIKREEAFVPFACWLWVNADDRHALDIELAHCNGWRL